MSLPSTLYRFAASAETKGTLRFAVMLLLMMSIQLTSHAQATLSIQGILKKSTGVAVEDGTYDITFKLYTVATGGTAIWTEVQSGVEVSSGIYSTVLGNLNPLSVSFGSYYYLGVTIGSAELTPRIQLTSAPYAMSLIGTTNQFGSSGLVKADSIKVSGSVVARGGAPGINGASHNGYAFAGNNGDRDSGLFSTGEGKVSLYVNNTEKLAVTNTNIVMTGDVTASGDLTAASLALSDQGGVSYNGIDDWRLVREDYLTNGANGWAVHNPLNGQNNGWNNPTSGGAAPIEGVNSNFAGLYLYPANNNQVMKKQFNLADVGPFNYIKVKFKYYIIDSWGWGTGDRAWAAFADGASGSQMRIAWDYIPAYLNDTGEFTNEFTAAANFEGNATQGELTRNGEMTTFSSGNSFWLYFGAALDEGTTNESYGVGMIEVWVK